MRAIPINRDGSENGLREHGGRFAAAKIACGSSGTAVTTSGGLRNLHSLLPVSGARVHSYSARRCTSREIENPQTRATGRKS